MESQQKEPIKPDLSLLNLCRVIAERADAVTFITNEQLRIELMELRNEIISYHQDVSLVIIDRYVEFVKRSYLSSEPIVKFKEYYDTKRYEIE
ncbi:MAG: hypothetical protein WCK98_03490 [bacterium]